MGEFAPVNLRQLLAHKYIAVIVEISQGKKICSILSKCQIHTKRMNSNPLKLPDFGASLCSKRVQMGPFFSEIAFFGF